MTAAEVIARMPPSERLAVVSEDGEIMYMGFVALYKGECSGYEVTRIGLHTEVFRIVERNERLHKLETVICPPDQWSDMQFRELEFLVYTQLVVKK